MAASKTLILDHDKSFKKGTVIAYHIFEDNIPKKRDINSWYCAKGISFG